MFHPFQQALISGLYPVEPSLDDTYVTIPMLCDNFQAQELFAAQKHLHHSSNLPSAIWPETIVEVAYGCLGKVCRLRLNIHTRNHSININQRLSSNKKDNYSVCICNYLANSQRLVIPSKRPRSGTYP